MARKASPQSERIVRALIADNNEAIRAVRDGHFQDIAWMPIKCANYDLDEKGERHYHHIDKIPCNCPPGPQIWQYTTMAYETWCVGSRGSAKSEGTFGFLMKGNPTPWKSGHSCDSLYVNHPGYTALIVRKDAQDLDDYFARLKALVEPMGAKCTTAPMKVQWPSGAVWYFAHLKDEDSILKQQGKSYIRVVCEEAGQIPSEKLYIQALQASCRSKYPELHPQLMLVSNPGGPGHFWINRRFRYPHGGAKPWPEKTFYEWKSPNGTVLTRQWIHSTVLDNPYYLAGNATYVAALQQLKETDPTLYRQWYLGDPDAVEGQFFERFRKQRLAGEPENACHVIVCEKHPDGRLAKEPVDLKPWYPRAIAIDWGYNHPAVVVWGAWDENRRLQVYRELKVNQLGTVELGAQVAKLTMPDLVRMRTPQITVHLSHDAFHRTDYSNTEAEQIAQGIDLVLGSGGAFVAGTTIDEEMMDAAERSRSMEARIAREGAKAMIRLVPAGGPKRRKPGWTLLRDYMRWWSMADPETEKQKTIASILATQGYAALTLYLQQQERLSKQALPVLQIWDVCPNVIAGIENAQRDERDSDDVQKQDGDDEIDALNYLVMGFQVDQLDKPHEVWVHERVREIIGNGPSDIQRLIAANEMAEREFRMRNAGRAVSIPRLHGNYRRNSMAMSTRMPLQ